MPYVSSCLWIFKSSLWIYCRYKSKKSLWSEYPLPSSVMCVNKCVASSEEGSVSEDEMLGRRADHSRGAYEKLLLAKV